MITKIVTIIILGIYIILGIWNIRQPDSDFLIQRAYKALKEIYWRLFYG